MFKKSMALAIMAAFTISAHANSDTDAWQVSVGFGAASLPAYLGDNKNRVAFAPDISVTYGDRFFASSLGGIGYSLLNSDGWQAGPIMKYHPGRQEDGDEPYFVGGDDTSDLLGLGDIDDTAEIGGFVTYSTEQLRARLEIRQATQGHEGAVGELSVQWMGSTNTKTPLSYSIGPEMVIGDSDYTGAFFSIDDQQSSAAGLASYDASGGLVSFGISGSVTYALNKDWSLVGYGSVSRLSEEIADSSLVAARGADTQSSIGAFLSFSY